MINAFKTSTDENLQPLSHYLWGINIAHRVSKQADQQIIWVSSPLEVEQVKQAYRHYQQKTLPLVKTQKIPKHKQSIQQQKDFYFALEKLRKAPCISLLMLISIVTTLLLQTGIEHSVFNALRMGTIDYIFESGQLWRLITPIFLHLDMMHLTFNMVLLWVFGHQIESHEKRSTLLALLLFFSIIPNIAQAVFVGILFGGISGVVYAVLAYCWLYNKLSPQPIFPFPKAFMGLMIVCLIAGFTDIFSWLRLPKTANIAHLCGLLIGLFCAWGKIKIITFKKKRER